MLKFLIALIIPTLGYSLGAPDLKDRCVRFCSDCSKLPNKNFCLDHCSSVLNTERCRATPSIINSTNDAANQASLDFNEKIVRLMQAYPSAQQIINNKYRTNVGSERIISPAELEDVLSTLFQLLKITKESLTSAVRDIKSPSFQVKLQQLQGSSAQISAIFADAMEAANWLKVNWTAINSHYKEYYLLPEMEMYRINNVQNWADETLKSIKMIYIQANSFNIIQRSQKQESLTQRPIPISNDMDHQQRLERQSQVLKKLQMENAQVLQDLTSKTDTAPIVIKSCYRQCRASVCGKNFNVFKQCMDGCPAKSVVNCEKAGKASNFWFQYQLQKANESR